MCLEKKNLQTYFVWTGMCFRIQTCISCPIRLALLIPLVKWWHEKTPLKEGLSLQSGAGPHSWAGGAKRAAGSGLWPRNVHRCGGHGLVICCLGSGRFKGLPLYALDQKKVS